MNHNLLATKAFITSFNLPSLHWRSTEKRKRKKIIWGLHQFFMNFHLGHIPLLPWSIDQAAVIYLPPGATAAISRHCHWLRLHHRQSQSAWGPLCSFCSKHREPWSSNWNPICTSYVSALLVVPLENYVLNSSVPSDLLVEPAILFSKYEKITFLPKYLPWVKVI